MATLPDYVTVLLAGFGDRIDPSVQRTEMARGPAKQTLLNSQVRHELQATLFFRTRDDANAFEDWYLNDIKRIGYFGWVYPRTGQTVQARFVGGDIGTLVPHVGRFFMSQRDVTMEFYA
ncbi:hypothetical protein AAV94_11145 [Lampropedia cohaerens]|uniref:Uncharacterized protein n=1 Tax=Lampropedia cohaerens TaxID=1610491 RepID=A0A0U1PXY5_9BURK|nr:hypothetical protein [Lampropedia cohaerens]KKW67388.1 hypothetical protein AAV94_11145 [Lampropedia cohaerens]